MVLQKRHYRNIWIVVLALLCLLTTLMPVTSMAASKQSTTASQQTDAQIEQKAAAFQKKYGVEVIYKSVPTRKGVTFSSKMTNRQLSQQLDDMDKVFAVYPKDFAKTVKLKKIYLVKDLTSGKYSADGLSIASMFGPRLRESIMYLNVPSGNGAVYTLHHELMHVMEYAMPSDRAAWIAIVGSDDDDVYWENASGDLSGYANRAGFVTNYAGYSVMEDRAETYAVLMAAPYGEKALKRLREDKEIQAKAKFIVSYCKTCFPSETAFIARVQAGYDAIYGVSSTTQKAA